MRIRSRIDHCAVQRSGGDHARQIKTVPARVHGGLRSVAPGGAKQRDEKEMADQKEAAARANVHGGVSDAQSEMPAQPTKNHRQPVNRKCEDKPHGLQLAQSREQSVVINPSENEIEQSDRDRNAHHPLP